MATIAPPTPRPPPPASAKPGGPSPRVAPPASAKPTGTSAPPPRPALAGPPSGPPPSAATIRVPPPSTPPPPSGAPPPSATAVRVPPPTSPPPRTPPTDATGATRPPPPKRGTATSVPPPAAAPVAPPADATPLEEITVEAGDVSETVVAPATPPLPPAAKSTPPPPAAKLSTPSKPSGPPPPAANRPSMPSGPKPGAPAGPKPPAAALKANAAGTSPAASVTGSPAAPASSNVPSADASTAPTPQRSASPPGPVPATAVAAPPVPKPAVAPPKVPVAAVKPAGAGLKPVGTSPAAATLPAKPGASPFGATVARSTSSPSTDGGAPKLVPPPVAPLKPSASFSGASRPAGVVVPAKPGTNVTRPAAPAGAPPRGVVKAAVVPTPAAAAVARESASDAHVVSEGAVEQASQELPTEVEQATNAPAPAPLPPARAPATAAAGAAQSTAPAPTPPPEPTPSPVADAPASEVSMTSLVPPRIATPPAPPMQASQPSSPGIAAPAPVPVAAPPAPVQIPIPVAAVAPTPTPPPTPPPAPATAPPPAPPPVPTTTAAAAPQAVPTTTQTAPTPPAAPPAPTPSPPPPVPAIKVPPPSAVSAPAVPTAAPSSPRPAVAPSPSATGAPQRHASSPPTDSGAALAQAKSPPLPMPTLPLQVDSAPSGMRSGALSTVAESPSPSTAGPTPMAIPVPSLASISPVKLPAAAAAVSAAAIEAALPSPRNVSLGPAPSDAPKPLALPATTVATLPTHAAPVLVPTPASTTSSVAVPATTSAFTAQTADGSAIRPAPQGASLATSTVAATQAVLSPAPAAANFAFPRTVPAPTIATPPPGPAAAALPTSELRAQVQLAAQALREQRDFMTASLADARDRMRAAERRARAAELDAARGILKSAVAQATREGLNVGVEPTAFDQPSAPTGDHDDPGIHTRVLDALQRTAANVLTRIEVARSQRANRGDVLSTAGLDALNAPVFSKVPPSPARIEELQRQVQDARKKAQAFVAREAELKQTLAAAHEHERGSQERWAGLTAEFERLRRNVGDGEIGLASQKTALAAEVDRFASVAQNAPSLAHSKAVALLESHLQQVRESEQAKLEPMLAAVRTDGTRQLAAAREASTSNMQLWLTSTLQAACNDFTRLVVDKAMDAALARQAVIDMQRDIATLVHLVHDARESDRLRQQQVSSAHLSRTASAVNAFARSMRSPPSVAPSGPAVDRWLSTLRSPSAGVLSSSSSSLRMAALGADAASLPTEVRDLFMDSTSRSHTSRTTAAAGNGGGGPSSSSDDAVWFQRLCHAWDRCGVDVVDRVRFMLQVCLRMPFSRHFADIWRAQAAAVGMTERLMAALQSRVRTLQAEETEEQAFWLSTRVARPLAPAQEASTPASKARSASVQPSSKSATPSTQDTRSRQATRDRAHSTERSRATRVSSASKPAPAIKSPPPARSRASAVTVIARKAVADAAPALTSSPGGASFLTFPMLEPSPEVRAVIAHSGNVSLQQLAYPPVLDSRAEMGNDPLLFASRSKAGTPAGAVFSESTQDMRMASLGAAAGRSMFNDYVQAQGAGMDALNGGLPSPTEALRQRLNAHLAPPTAATAPQLHSPPPTLAVSSAAARAVDSAPQYAAAELSASLRAVTRPATTTTPSLEFESPALARLVRPTMAALSRESAVATEQAAAAIARLDAVASRRYGAFETSNNVRHAMLSHMREQVDLTLQSFGIPSKAASPAPGPAPRAGKTASNASSSSVMSSPSRSRAGSVPRKGLAGDRTLASPTPASADVSIASPQRRGKAPDVAVRTRTRPSAMTVAKGANAALDDIMATTVSKLSASGAAVDGHAMGTAELTAVAVAVAKDVTAAVEGRSAASETSVVSPPTGTSMDEQIVARIDAALARAVRP